MPEKIEEKVEKVIEEKLREVLPDKKPFFSIKDVIYILTIVLSIAASYFAQINKISLLEKQVIENTTVLKTNNLELINYKLDALIRTVDKLVAKLDK
jgi:hypothetical protein